MNKDNTWKTQATLLWKHSREKNDKQYFPLSKQNVGKFLLFTEIQTNRYFKLSIQLRGHCNDTD